MRGETPSEFVSSLGTFLSPKVFLRVLFAPIIQLYLIILYIKLLLFKLFLDSLLYSQADTELVLGATLGGRLAKMKFGVGFDKPLDVSHSAVPLADGKWELVITGTLGHHSPSPVFDCNEV